MLNWIRVIKELLILVSVVFNLICSRITHTVWEVVGYAIAVAHLALVAEFLNLIKFWRLIENHHGCTEGDWIEQKSDYSTTDAKSHLERKMLLLVL